MMIWESYHQHHLMDQFILDSVTLESLEKCLTQAIMYTILLSLMIVKRMKQPKFGILTIVGNKSLVLTIIGV